MRGSGFVLTAAIVWCRLQMLLGQGVDGTHRFVRRILASSQRLSGAFFSEALTIEERGRLTIHIYDSFPGYRAIGNRLYVWEQAWFRRSMPQPKARVLVGACGTGREAVALMEQGFQIDAFEPAPEFVAETRRRMSDRARVWTFRYEDLSAFILDGTEPPDTGFRRERYDAVLLGYGSLTHVLDPREQVRTLRSLDILCPSGPILASFFFADETPAGGAAVGRAVRLGHAMGRRVAKLRGIRSEHAPQQSYGSHCGFAHTFTRAEIEDLGRAVNRRVRWEQDGNETRSIHATFLPPGTQPESPPLHA